MPKKDKELEKEKKDLAAQKTRYYKAYGVKKDRSSSGGSRGDSAKDVARDQLDVLQDEMRTNREERDSIDERLNEEGLEKDEKDELMSRRSELKNRQKELEDEIDNIKGAL